MMAAARSRARLGALALSLWLVLGVALAQEFPALTGRVVDQANVIPPEVEAALTSALQAHEQKTTNQVVVATVASLGGREIEDYAVDLGRLWRIGQSEKNNGVLVVVAPNDRQIRIEVGYGLEGELTDAVSRLIIESSMLPRFRAGDFAGGIQRGVEDITAVLEGDAQAFRERTRERVSAEETAGSALTTFLFMAFMFLMLSGFGRGRRRRYRGGVGPVFLPGGFGGGMGGGFSGGGGSFGGGGASGRW